MKGKSNIMVTVVVVTYNQEKWIRQTLDSIVNQKTDYPYEVIVGEDYGTDGTRAICQEYADKYDNVTLLPSERNLGVVANCINCIQHGTGKYIMGCGGDDYWHNPNKIQIQVDYMEAHPECVICHTDCDVLWEDTGVIIPNRNKGINPPQGRIQKEILANGGPITAVTQCIRRDMFEKYIPTDKFIELKFAREDWPTWLILSAYGNVDYIPISTCTYRKGQVSISHMKNYDAIRSRYRQDNIMLKYIYTLFPEWGKYEAESYWNTYVYHDLLLAAYENNDYKSAHKFAKHDLKNTMVKRMAKSWITFKLWRLYRKYYIRQLHSR